MAGRIVGSDVKTATTDSAATGGVVLQAGRSRLRGYIIAGGASDGTVTFRDGSVGSLGVVVTIEGKVNLPSASLHNKIFPACASTVKVVSAVRLTVALLPAEINPAKDLTGPEKVDLAIIFS